MGTDGSVGRAGSAGVLVTTSVTVFVTTSATGRTTRSTVSET
ncbi:hypothetical protein [Streptomyces sp. NPDC126522]